MTEKIDFSRLDFDTGLDYITCCKILTQFSDLMKHEGEEKRIEDSFQSILTTCHDPIKLMIIMVGTIDIIINKHHRLAFQVEDFKKFLINMCSKIIDQVEDI